MCYIINIIFVFVHEHIDWNDMNYYFALKFHGYFIGIHPSLCLDESLNFIFYLCDIHQFGLKLTMIYLHLFIICTLARCWYLWLLFLWRKKMLGTNCLMLFFKIFIEIFLISKMVCHVINKMKIPWVFCVWWYCVNKPLNSTC